MESNVRSARSFAIVIMDSTGRKTINVTAGDSVEFSLPDNRVGKLTLDIDALLVEKFGGQEVDMCSLLAFEYKHGVNQIVGAQAVLAHQIAGKHIAAQAARATLGVRGVGGSHGE